MINLEKTNTDKFLSFIDKAQNILVVTHSNPDGDTVGAALAIAKTVSKKGKQVSVVSPNPLPDFLEWLSGADNILIYSENPEAVEKIFDEADTLFCMDFNAPHRVGKMSPLLKEINAVKILIDHHPFPDESYFDLMFSFSIASSTSELLYVLLENTGLIEQMDKDIASAIFVGIMTDTGSFAHSCNHKEVFEISAKLIEKGDIDVKAVHDRVYNSYEEKRLRFLGFCISEKLVVLNNHKTAYIWVTQQEMNHYQVNEGDLEGVVNYSLSIKNIDLAILLKEKDDFVKMSFRSKKDFNVNEFARKYFHGGGHKNAAGGKSYKPMDKTIIKLEKLIKEIEF